MIALSTFRQLQHLAQVRITPRRHLVVGEAESARARHELRLKLLSLTLVSHALEVLDQCLLLGFHVTEGSATLLLLSILGPGRAGMATMQSLEGAR